MSGRSFNAATRPLRKTVSRNVKLHRGLGYGTTVGSVEDDLDPLQLPYTAQTRACVDGLHARSIDEAMLSFANNLWGAPLAKKPDQEQQTIQQVWFAGGCTRCGRGLIHRSRGGAFRRSRWSGCCASGGKAGLLSIAVGL